MPTLLHDPAVTRAIRTRVSTLRPDAARRWGKMSVDQMLWHCNQAMDQALSIGQPEPFTPAPLPRGIIKFMVFNMPWPKGAPTSPSINAGTQRFDFDSERARCLRMIDQLTAKSMQSADWGISPAFGQMTGVEWSRLMAKHLDHHLKQFGA